MIFFFTGWIELAAEKLPTIEAADGGYFLQATLVYYARTVPDEICLEC